MSERSLRRAFHDTVGMSPKAFAKLARFHRAVHAARDDLRGGWGRIAVDAGYYDQAHLTRSLRKLIGATPSSIEREERQLSFLYKT